MKIKVSEVAPVTSRRYPYSHRVEVFGPEPPAPAVSAWLKENAIPHTQIGLGVYYLNKQNTKWLLLRWS
jgi:hypothetical protein